MWMDANVFFYWKAWANVATLMGPRGLQLKLSRCAAFSCRAKRLRARVGRTSSPSIATGKTPTGGLEKNVAGVQNCIQSLSQ